MLLFLRLRVYNACEMSTGRKTSNKANDLSLVTSLQQLEGGFVFLVNQTPIIINIIDKKGIILYQSPNIKNILGYDHNSRLGKNFIQSKVVHPSDIAVKERLIEKTFKSPHQNFSDELRLLHKNGTWRWMQVIFNNQLDNPSVKGIVVITQDIHERKKLEAQKNEFLSIASHELRTPLTTIRAYSQLLISRLTKAGLNRKDLSFLEKIVVQTDRITHLINELLDLSKIQEGKLPVNMKPFRMQQLIKKVLEDFEYILDQQSVHLTGHTRTLVIGDEDKIRQVLTNLISNAIKYSPKGNDILIHVSKNGKEVVTSVTDHGVGIPAAKQKLVFDRFFRIEESRTQVSSGLGLYIASEILKLHNGKIWLQSKKGKGSTFYFSLPVSQ